MRKYSFRYSSRLGLKAFMIAFMMVLFLVEGGSQESIFINEIMASNGQTLSDEDGDFSDWIELFNSSDQPVNLQGYGLSDKTDNLYKWVFPNTILLPGEYMVIWASGKDKSLPGQPLHTNFSISAAGESIVLTSKTGEQIDIIPAVAIPRDLSYGRIPDGGALLNFFETPSPGGSNGDEGFEGILSPPTIEGVKQANGSFLIQIDHHDDQAEIKYTLNGKDPSLNGFVYEQPFEASIETRDSLMRIATVPIELAESLFAWKEPAEVAFPSAITLQAVATKPNYLTSAPTTKTFMDDWVDIPVVSIIADPDVLFGDELGIYVPGALYKELGFNWQHPVGAPNANYFLSGPEAERIIHVDFIYPDGKIHQQILGTRIHGSGSRTMPQKSLRFYARSGLGENTINFDIFQTGQTGYRRLTLRNSGQDFAYETTIMRDAVIQKVMSHFNAETQASQEVVVYMNGEFWGIQNLRERTDRHHLEQKYNIEPNMLDMLELDAVVIEGDYNHYDQLKRYVAENDLTVDSILSHLETLMDFKNYIDYNIAHIFSANYDWPGNNVSYWRYRTNQYEPDAPYGKDGRWRWILKDLDFGFGLWDRPGYHLNLFHQATTTEGGNWPNPPWSTLILRNLFKNQSFRNQFINRFCDQLNTGLLPGRMIDIIEEHAAAIAPYMELHTLRWGYPDHIQEWRENVEVLNTFAQKRPDVIRDQMTDFFELESAVPLQLDVSGSDQGFIRVNTVDVQSTTAGVKEQPYPWVGIYFRGVPIEIEALPRLGYEFSHWEGVVSSDVNVNPVTLNLKETENNVKAIFKRSDSSVRTPIYHWHFNQLPSGHLNNIAPNISIHQNAGIQYLGSGPGYLDRVDEGTEINSLTQDAGSALRVRNPSKDRELIFTMPTIDYTDLMFSFATQRTNNGATAQKLYYKITQQEDWIPIEEARFINLEWELVEVDLSAIPKSSNNANFALKIEFLGSSASNTSGNNRFDNVTLTGRQIDEVQSENIISEFQLFPNPFQRAITLDLEITKMTRLEIQLHNMGGKYVKSLFKGNTEQGNYRFTDDLSSLPSGSYLISILTESDTKIIPIVKQ